MFKDHIPHVIWNEFWHMDYFSPVTGYGELPGSHDREPHGQECFYFSASEPMFDIPVAGAKFTVQRLQAGSELV